MKSVRIVICLLVFVSAKSIAFEGDRYQFFAGIGYNYDNNVFRTPKSGITPPKKDLIRNTYIGVGLNLPVSMQRFVINARATQTRFRDLDGLDYNGNSLSASWLWQLGSDWSGRMGYSKSRTASDFSNVSGTTQNLRDQSQVYFDAGVMLDVNHRFEFGASQAKSQNSESANQGNDYTDNQLYFGIQYISAANNSYGLRLSYDDQKLPNPTRFQSGRDRIAVDNSHQQGNLDFNYSWTFNGVSKIFGRFGFEERKYNSLNGRDYTGLSWNFSYDWTPNDKSAVLFNFRREIDGLNDFASNYALVYGVSIKPRWSVSSKLNVAWNFDYSQLEFRGETGIANIPESDRKDKLKNFGLSIGYTPQPSLTTSLSINRNQRSSNVSGVEFDDTVYAGSVDFKF